MATDPPEKRKRIKVLKVKLPMDHHLTLHRLRLLTGKSISQTVKEALESYLGDDYRELTDAGPEPVQAGDVDKAQA